MKTWTNAVVTRKGLALQSKLIAGTTLTITRAVAGAGYVDPESLTVQTDVSDPKQTRYEFGNVSYPESGKCAVRLDLKNDDVEIGYVAMQIGFYAEDPDEGEILYFIAQAESGAGTIIPSTAEMPGYSAEWTFYFQYGMADNVSVTVDPSNSVTQIMLEEALEKHNQDPEAHPDITEKLDSLSDVAFSGSYNDLENKPTIPEKVTVVDNLTSASATSALSANQGKKLKESLDSISIIANNPKRMARIIIGTSTAGWTLNECDYLCDGTSDQTEIKDAINALPSGGGKIVILDGKYNISGTVPLKENVKIIGNGTGTVFRKKANISNMIIVKTNCSVSDIYLDGNKSEFSSGSLIYLSESENTIIQNVHITSAYYGIQFGNSPRNIISKNIIHDCYAGIYFAGSTPYSLIDGNYLRNNDIGINIALNKNLVTNNYIIRGTGAPSDYLSTQYTIKCNGSDNLFANNFILGKNYVDTGTGNTWVNNKFE